VKAAIFENPGLENLRVMDNIKKPQLPGHDVLIKVKIAGINPIDNFVVSGALPKLIPLPNHKPGAEISGVVEEVGSHINGNNLRIGDRVIVHNKIFDDTCDMCFNGLDMICRNGGLISE
jgi:NADPH:quinone reductase-like Zn-dependent oxidoreductase